MKLFLSAYFCPCVNKHVEMTFGWSLWVLHWGQVLQLSLPKFPALDGILIQLTIRVNLFFVNIYLCKYIRKRRGWAKKAFMFSWILGNFWNHITNTIHTLRLAQASCPIAMLCPIPWCKSQCPPCVKFESLNFINWRPHELTLSWRRKILPKRMFQS